MQIRILKQAQTDLELGRTFYNQQQQGVGDYFWSALLSDIESLTLYAGVHIKVNGFFRMTAKRFPYSIYYTFYTSRSTTTSSPSSGTEGNSKKVDVIAVLPDRRNPEWLKDRLKS